jgi:flagellar hook-associated protein 2
MPGIYSLQVMSLGSQTNTMSNAGGGDGSTTVTDPTSQNIDSSQNYTLTVNGQIYNITGASSLDQLAQAINTSGASVQATVVNVGGSSSPDYRLSVQSLNYAPDTIQLSDNGSNTALLSNVGPVGSAVEYQVNGQSTTVTSNSRNINLSTGLSVTLQGTGSTTIDVGQNLSGVSNALSSFVSAYNTALNDVSNNRGQNGGALSGQAIVYALNNALQSIANFAGASGTVTSLAALGVTFSQTGQLSFDSSTFYELAATSPSSITNFLGSETGSSGFLQNAENVLQSVTSPGTGILTQATSSLATEVSNISTQISDDQARVAQLQSTLTSQMAAADATISAMESQVSEMTTLFSDMQTYAYANSH